MSDGKPASLKAKEWEQECLESFSWIKKRNYGHMSRYGVSASFMKGEWRPISSLPDFEGVLNHDGMVGRQFIFDCKVCSGPSFPLTKLREERKRQLIHMLDRADVGAICFFAVWFNAHTTTSNHYPPESWAFPVYREHPLWSNFAQGFGSTITRLACEEYAVPIQWQVPPRGNRIRPDLLTAIHAVATSVEQARTAASAKDEEWGQW